MAIGFIGVAVIGPIAQPDNPFYDLSAFGKEILADDLGAKADLFAPSVFYVIQWNLVGVALVVHLIAHLVMLRYRDE